MKTITSTLIVFSFTIFVNGTNTKNIFSFIHGHQVVTLVVY